MSLAVERDLFDETLDELRPLWTRADEAHVAFDHVPQLRELVQARGAEPPANPGEPLTVGKNTSTLIVSVGHRSELDERERDVAQPGPALPEQHRRAERGPDQRGDGDKQRGQQGECKSGNRRVERSFAEPCVPPGPNRLEARRSYPGLDQLRV